MNCRRPEVENGTDRGVRLFPQALRDEHDSLAARPRREVTLAAVARAIWSGSISFGLVSVPVKLFNATAPQDVRFHQFERDSGRRIRYRRVTAEGPVEW